MSKDWESSNNLLPLLSSDERKKYQSLPSFHKCFICEHIGCIRHDETAEVARSEIIWDEYLRLLQPVKIDLTVSQLCRLLFPLACLERLEHSFVDYYYLHVYSGDPVKKIGQRLSAEFGKVNDYFEWRDNESQEIAEMLTRKINLLAYKESWLKNREGLFSEVMLVWYGYRANGQIDGAGADGSDIPIPPSKFLDTDSKFCDLLREVDKEYRKEFRKQVTARALFSEIPRLCPRLAKEIQGEGESRKILLVDGGYLAWIQFRDFHFKKHFPDT